MTLAIRLVGNFPVKPDQRDLLLSLLKTAAESAKASEPETLMLEAYAGPDGRRVTWLQYYAGSIGLEAHLKGLCLAHMFPQFVETSESIDINVFGVVTPEVEAMLKPMGATVSKPNSGFTR